MKWGGFTYDWMKKAYPVERSDGTRPPRQPADSGGANRKDGLFSYPWMREAYPPKEE
jgi:hypothetical protein